MISLSKILVSFFLLTFAINTSLFAETTKLDLLLPSGATTKLSRTYANLVKEFEKKNPGIVVSFKAKQNYNAVLETTFKKIANKQSAGVIAAEVSELLTLKDKDAILSLEDLLNEEEGGVEGFLKPIIPGFLENSYGDDGKLYGIPLMRSTPVIYYNMDILKKIGVDQNQLPKTWDDLTALLTKLKNETGNTPLGLAPTWYGWLFEAFVRQNGGSLANKNNTQVQFDDPATIGALTYWKNLVDQGLMKRHKGSWGSTIKAFAKGDYAVTYFSSGGMGGLVESAKINWMADIMPKNTNYGTPVGAANLFITKNLSSAQNKAAVKLIKFLLSADSQARISHKSGYFPVTQAAFDKPILKERYSMEQFKRVRKQLEFAKSKIMTRNYMEIRNVLKAGIDRTLDDSMEAKKSMTMAQQEAQKWLKIGAAD